MYQPPISSKPSRGAAALIREHPFGLLVTDGASGLAANGIPFLLDPDPAGGPACCAPTSRAPTRSGRRRAATASRWSSSRDRRATSRRPGIRARPSTARSVPTWNYVDRAGARRGCASIDDAEWLRAFVTRLTERHEGERARAPWAVSDAPADYVETMLRAIVGVEIELTLARRQVEGEPEPPARRPRRRRRRPGRRGRRRSARRMAAGGARPAGERGVIRAARDGAAPLLRGSPRSLLAGPGRAARGAAPRRSRTRWRSACSPAPAATAREGRAARRRLLPAHRRQAGRLPVQPAAATFATAGATTR